MSGDVARQPPTEILGPVRVAVLDGAHEDSPCLMLRVKRSGMLFEVTGFPSTHSLFGTGFVEASRQPRS